MDKVKFIYNPFSGEQSIISEIEKIIGIHQKYGYQIVPFRLSFEYDMKQAFEGIDENYKFILVAGGDGTIDSTVNYMMNNNVKLPIAILPSGTANDFAKFIGMPQDVEAACELILNSIPKKIDIGKINDKYFVNVASAGLFTDVSQKTDINVKNTIGKLAYYLKGIEQLPNFRKLNIKIKSRYKKFDGDMYLMFVFNGQTAGNFKFAYKAKVDDGLLDVIIIKACALKDLIPLFINMMKGEHLKDSNALIYFTTSKLEIECHEDIVTDIDGERGPDFPIKIECIKAAIQILGVIKS